MGSRFPVLAATAGVALVVAMLPPAGQRAPSGSWLEGQSPPAVRRPPLTPTSGSPLPPEAHDGSLAATRPSAGTRVVDPEWADTGAIAPAAASPTASAPRKIRFEAGRHTGYRFDASWQVAGRKAATLSRPSSASATARRTIDGRAYLRVSTGIWTGYWVRESALAYLPGRVGDVTYRPSRSVRFDPGRYMGYRFRTDGHVSTTRTIRITDVRTGGADLATVRDGRRYVHMVSGAWAGYWIPGTSTTPTPIRCTAGARPAAGSRQLLQTVPDAGREMALTFDMGGRLDPAASIIELLLLERVCTTVFPTGSAARTTVGRQVMATIAANPSLFEVGDHTDHHCDLVRGGGGAACPTVPPTDAFIRSELTSAAATIRELTGQDPRPYWRPPYGSHDLDVRVLAASMGFTKTILWSVDTIDWRPQDGDPPGPTPYQVASKIRADATSGGIVLMHLGGYSTRDALPFALAGLRNLGYRATSLSDLFRAG